MYAMARMSRKVRWSSLAVTSENWSRTNAPDSVLQDVPFGKGDSPFDGSPNIPLGETGAFGHPANLVEQVVDAIRSAGYQAMAVKLGAPLDGT